MPVARRAARGRRPGRPSGGPRWRAPVAGIGGVGELDRHEWADRIRNSWYPKWSLLGQPSARAFRSSRLIRLRLPRRCSDLPLRSMANRVVAKRGGEMAAHGAGSWVDDADLIVIGPERNAVLRTPTEVPQDTVTAERELGTRRSVQAPWWGQVNTHSAVVSGTWLRSMVPAKAAKCLAPRRRTARSPRSGSRPRSARSGRTSDG